MIEAPNSLSTPSAGGVPYRIPISAGTAESPVSTGERLGHALRRSGWLLVAGAVIGAALGILLGLASTTEYQASAGVFIQQRDIAALIAHLDLQNDGSHNLADATALAESQQFSNQVAHQLSKGNDQVDLSVANSAAFDVLYLQARASTPAVAITVANTAASLLANDFRELVLPTATDSGNTTAKFQQSLQTARALDALSPPASVLASAVKAPKVAPLRRKEAEIGLAGGLVVALLLAAAREAFDTRVWFWPEVADWLPDAIPVRLQRGRPVTSDIEDIAAQVATLERPGQSTVISVLGSLDDEADPVSQLVAALIAGGVGVRVLTVSAALASQLEPLDVGVTTVPSAIAMAAAARNADRSGTGVVLAILDGDIGSFRQSQVVEQSAATVVILRLGAFRDRRLQEIARRLEQWQAPDVRPVVLGARLSQ